MIKKTWIAFLLFSMVITACESQLKEDERLIENMMRREGKFFKEYLANKDTFEIQIIYTQINRDSANRPHFKSFYFNVDTSRYFYPASTVKLPLVLLSLEKINRLNRKGLDKFTPVYHDSLYAGQKRVEKDTTSENGLPSIAHYAKKILVVSDNDAYNRLYEFLGQRYIFETLRQKGYRLRVLHRFDRQLTPDENRHTEAVRFVRQDSLVYQQPMLVNTDSIRPPRKVMKGIGWLKNDTLVNEPFDFTYKNFFSLPDQQNILKSVLFPEAVGEQARFDLTTQDRQFVLQYLSQLPAETAFPKYYSDTAYYDAYCKFLMYGQGKDPISPSIRIFNKVGNAYGYMIDNAYVVDFENKIEFMLAAVINTNTDAIYNDGKYEYKKRGYPFMKELGQMIYRYERKRKRANTPDLTVFKLSYDREK